MREQLREAALLSSLADPTPEGKSIVKLAREQGCAGCWDQLRARARAFIAFTAQTRMSGVDLDDAVRG
jgi:K+-transporting ATPase ATPase B chain